MQHASIGDEIVEEYDDLIQSKFAASNISKTAEDAKRWLDRISPFLEKAPTGEPHGISDIEHIKLNDDGVCKVDKHQDVAELSETLNTPDECDAFRFKSNEIAIRWRDTHKTKHQKMRAQRRLDHKAKIQNQKESICRQDVQMVTAMEQQDARESIYFILMFICISILIPLVVFTTHHMIV